MKTLLNYIPIIVLFQLSVAGLPTYACTQLVTNSDQESIMAISVKQLAERGDAMLGRRVRVVGILKNIGTNYFTDLRVVLKDPSLDGGFVYVRPWLPIELPPALPRGRPEKTPDTLSKYLDQRVELTAVFKKATLKHVGEVRLLEVESVRIL